VRVLSGVNQSGEILSGVIQSGEDTLWGQPIRWGYTLGSANQVGVLFGSTNQVRVLSLRFGGGVLTPSSGLNQAGQGTRSAQQIRRFYSRDQCFGSGVPCLFGPGSGIRNRFFPDLESRIPNPYFGRLMTNLWVKSTGLQFLV
jgi:hypothetical protein